MGFIQTVPTGVATYPGLDTTMLAGNPDYAFLNSQLQSQVTQSTVTAGTGGMESLA